MATTLIYEKILMELRAGELGELESKVLDLLIEADGETVTRHQFIKAIYGYTPVGSLSGNKHDRKVRKAIESLREKGATFILSSSGEAGYRMDMSIEKAEEMAGELESRARKLSDMAEKIREALEPVRIPESVRVAASPLHTQPRQMSFIGEQS